MTWLNALRKLASRERSQVEAGRGAPGYDHDAVDASDLRELLCVPDDASQFEEAQPCSASIDDLQPQLGVEAGEEPEFCEASVDEEVAPELQFDDEDLAPPATVTAAPAPHFDFDIPDIDVSVVEESEDFVPEVHEERRARQLAAKFLLAFGELTTHNIDLVSDIIAARRWSSAQLRVRALMQAGYGVRQVHSAFVFAEAWRHSDVLDERFDWHETNPRLSWLEAIELSEFFGGTGDVEEMLAFAERERLVWRDDRELVRRFPSFKQYLVHHRIRSEYQHRELGCWTRTLDGHDDRYFDGTGNPEYSSDWWDDDIADRWSRTGMALRIYRGASFEGLVLERMSLHDWSEE